MTKIFKTIKRGRFKQLSGSRESAYLILVEGPSDAYVIERLVQQHFPGNDVIESVQIVASNGSISEGDIDRIFNLSSAINLPLRTVAIIVDGDAAPEEAYRRITTAITQFGYTPPSQPFSYSNDAPRVGIFITPGQHLSGTIEIDLLKGTLEHYYMQSINYPTNENVSRDIFIQHVIGKSAIDDIFDISNAEAKTIASIDLLSQGLIPDVGIAARDNKWKIEGKHFEALSNFIRQLHVD